MSLSAEINTFLQNPEAAFLKEATQAAKLAFALWQSTKRYPTAEWEKHILSQAKLEYFAYAENQYPLYYWGTGPGVLLIHGWSGRGSQLSQIALSLAEVGYQTYCIDLPAHGSSPGEATDLLALGNFLAAYLEAHPNITTLIGHSFGASLCFYLLAHYPLLATKIKAFVSISSPHNFRGGFDYFLKSLALSEWASSKMIRYFESVYGEKVWEQFSPEYNARGITTSGLILQDQKDAIVPSISAKKLSAAWPQAKVCLTQGLGHHRILRAQESIQFIQDFLRQA